MEKAFMEYLKEMYKDACESEETARKISESPKVEVQLAREQTLAALVHEGRKIALKSAIEAYEEALKLKDK